jgi:hypothetical protein
LQQSDYTRVRQFGDFSPPPIKQIDIRLKASLMQTCIRQAADFGKAEGWKKVFFSEVLSSCC